MQAVLLYGQSEPVIHTQEAAEWAGGIGFDAHLIKKDRKDENEMIVSGDHHY